jgi:hypothetical protein
MPSLVVYINELSQPPHEMQHNELYNWSISTRTLLITLKEIATLRADDLEIGFQSDSLDLVINQKPLFSWLNLWLSADEVLWLKNKIKRLEPDLSQWREVHFEEKPTIGLTCALNSDSWSVSFSKDGSPWQAHIVQAQCIELVDDDLKSYTCEIRNFSNQTHVTHWNTALAAWGQEVSRNNTIFEFEGTAVVMYQFDHAPPIFI